MRAVTFYVCVNRFPNSSPPPPGLASINSLRERDSSEGRGANNNNASERGGSGNDTAGDFNPAAAYLWLVAQQQQQAGAPGSALNLSSRNAIANSNGVISNNGNGNGTPTKNSNHNASKHNSIGRNNDDETTDDEDDDDVESHTSSRHSDNPVSSTGFNGKSKAPCFVVCAKVYRNARLNLRSSSDSTIHHLLTGSSSFFHGFVFGCLVVIFMVGQVLQL